MLGYSGEQSAQSRLEQARYQYENLLLNAGGKMLETPNKSPSYQPRSNEKSTNSIKMDNLRDQSGIYGGVYGDSTRSSFIFLSMITKCVI